MPTEPLWKSLVDQLKDQGVESPYLERLRVRMDLTQGRDSLEREILSEIASALGRAEDKVNYALLRLDIAGRELDALPPDGDRTRREEALAAFHGVRDEAERARWELMVHREAVGLPRENLENFYPIPPRRRA